MTTLLSRLCRPNHLSALRKNSVGTSNPYRFTPPDMKRASRRMLKKAVQQGRRRVETGGVPLGHVEDFEEPRTSLADFFGIL